MRLHRLLLYLTVFGAFGATSKVVAEDAEPPSALASLKVSTSEEFTLITTRLFSGWIEIGPEGDYGWGLTISSSAPVNVKSVTEYMDAQLLLPEGGVLNAYINPVSFYGLGVKKKKAAGAANGQTPVVNPRDQFRERIYFQDRELDTSLVYLDFGLGVKGLSVNLGQEDSSYGAAGSAYLSVGLDGYIFGHGDEETLGQRKEGWYDVSLFTSASITSSDVIEDVYEFSGHTDPIVSTGVKFQAFVSSTIGIDFSYARPHFDAKKFMGSEILMLSFGYSQ